MGTPWQCLERIAADVASLVPDEKSIVRVEVEFDTQPFEVRFVSAIYRPNELWDPASGTRLTVSSDQVARVRNELTNYKSMMESPDRELECVTLTVAIDGSWGVGETCRDIGFRK